MRYAKIIDGVVVEVIEPLLDGEGNEFPIEERFHPEMAKWLVDISSLGPDVGPGWVLVGGKLEPPPTPRKPTAAQQAQADIVELEASITPRRIREAVLGTDSGWLASVEAKIDTLRAKIK